jgi:copper(I)-binding protein
MMCASSWRKLNLLQALENNIMKRTGVLVLLVVAAMLVAAPVALTQDEPESCDLVYLFDTWARATVEGAPTSAVYGFLVNLGAEMDRLVSASTDAAEVVELHEVVMGMGDVMQMRPVEGGFMIPPGAYAELKPGGYHIMLINLTTPLAAGEAIELTLNFARAAEVTLTVPIRDAAAMTGDMNMETDDEAAMTEVMMPPEAPAWPEACAGLHVLDAWVRPAGMGMPTSAAYGLLLNLTPDDDVLVSAVSDAAEVVELHEMVMDEGDVMRMRPVEGGIAIPASGLAQLRPGGLHIMLINLTRQLQTGDMVEITLTFAESGEQTLLIPVRDPESGAMEMGGHG